MWSTFFYHASDKKLDRSWTHDAVKIRLVFNADAMKITILGVEIRIGCVIEFEAGDEQSKMADDELLAMDLWQWFSVCTDSDLIRKIHGVKREPLSGSATPRPIRVFLSQHFSVSDRAIFKNLPVAHGKCSKIICRELRFVNSLESANFLIGQTAKRHKYNITKIHDKLFCFIYHMQQVNF